MALVAAVDVTVGVLEGVVPHPSKLKLHRRPRRLVPEGVFAAALAREGPFRGLSSTETGRIQGALAVREDTVRSSWPWVVCSSTPRLLAVTFATKGGIGAMAVRASQPQGPACPLRNSMRYTG